MIRNITITDRIQEEILIDEKVKLWFEKLSDIIDNIDGEILEVYLDYSKTTRAIRVEISIKNNILIIIRHIIDKFDDDNIVTYSISIANKIMEVNWCNIDEIKNRIYENKKKYNW